jgi:hypothetical protein
MHLLRSPTSQELLVSQVLVEAVGFVTLGTDKLDYLTYIKQALPLQASLAVISLLLEAAASPARLLDSLLAAAPLLVSIPLDDGKNSKALGW